MKIKEIQEFKKSQENSTGLRLRAFRDLPESDENPVKFLPDLDFGEPRLLETFEILTQGVGAPKT